MLPQFKSPGAWIAALLCAVNVSAQTDRPAEILPLAPESLLLDVALAGDRLKLADLAELSPHQDIDNRSARVAARLCHQIVKATPN